MKAVEIGNFGDEAWSAIRQRAEEYADAGNPYPFYGGEGLDGHAYSAITRVGGYESVWVDVTEEFASFLDAQDEESWSIVSPKSLKRK